MERRAATCDWSGRPWRRGLAGPRCPAALRSPEFIPGSLYGSILCGHGRPGWVDYPGCLWLRLDRRTSEAFEKHASVLAGMREIDRVSKIYNEDGKEVVAIEFAGNERNLLAESERRIVRFFEQLILGDRVTSGSCRRGPCQGIHYQVRLSLAARVSSFLRNHVWANSSSSGTNAKCPNPSADGRLALFSS